MLRKINTPTKFLNPTSNPPTRTIAFIPEGYFHFSLLPNKNRPDFDFCLKKGLFVVQKQETLF
ncbi:hypothetical protein C0V77_09005 [Emticicia sp. TH156]|nr:hypothetical protein C0V77_09005 [Emticicia sp. TH156]